jgi:hypothetical protein
MLKDVFIGIFDFFIAVIQEVMKLLFAALSHWETWVIAALFVSFLSAHINVSSWIARVTGITGGLTAADFIRAAVNLFLSIWWFWLFAILWPLFRELWLCVKQEKFKASIKWVLLEIKIPREILQSPRAMEQVLAALHTLGNYAGSPKTFEGFRETYFDGEVTRWFALEMVSFGGEIHFYVRCYVKFKNLVESAFFSFYPDIEISEADDYVDLFPKNVGEVYEKKMDLWGSEMILRDDEILPIKSYPYFENPDEEKTLDPVSTFMEVLGKIKKEEIVAIQYLIAPSRPDWTKSEKVEEYLEKLKKPGAKAVSEDETQKLTMRTPGETEVLKAVENNLSKPSFDTLIRFLYLSPKDIFFEQFARRGIAGAFNQYSALNFNGFRLNNGTATRANVYNYPYIFFTTRVEYRKQRILNNYRIREVPPQTSIGKWMSSYFFNSGFSSKRFKMNTEGVASVFHPPTAMVLTAPHVRRLESKKAGPPAGLAIFGEEEEIERFVNPNK